MALKMTGGAWIAANDENRGQRDHLRKAFFSEAGLKPVSSLREVSLPGHVRLERTLALFEEASAKRINSADSLEPVISQMKAEIASLGLAAPEVMQGLQSQPLGLLGFSPETFKTFFDVDLETTFARSFMG